MFCSRFLQVLFSALPAARLADPQALLHRPAVGPATNGASSGRPAHCVPDSDSDSGRVQHCRLRLELHALLEQSNSRSEQAIRRVPVYPAVSTRTRTYNVHCLCLCLYRSTLPHLLILVRVRVHVPFELIAPASRSRQQSALDFDLSFRL